MISDINYFKLLDFHYVNKSSFTLVVEELPPKQKDEKLKAFQENPSTERFTYVLETGTNRLIGAVDPWDVQNAGIKLKTSVLARHPNVGFSTNLEQKGVVICSKGVASLLAEWGSEFDNFGEEFVTFLAYNQYNSKLASVFTAELGANEPESIAKYCRRSLGDTKDVFRPFVYVTSDFSQRIRSAFDFHQVNLMRVPRSKEMTWTQRTANDDDDMPINVVRAELPPTETQPSNPTEARPQPTEIKTEGGVKEPSPKTEDVEKKDGDVEEKKILPASKKNKGKEGEKKPEEEGPPKTSNDENSEKAGKKKGGEKQNPKPEKQKPEESPSQKQPQQDSKKKDGEPKKEKGDDKQKKPQEPKQEQQKKEGGAKPKK